MKWLGRVSNVTGSLVEVEAFDLVEWNNLKGCRLVFTSHNGEDVHLRLADVRDEKLIVPGAQSAVHVGDHIALRHWTNGDEHKIPD